MSERAFQEKEGCDVPDSSAIGDWVFPGGALPDIPSSPIRQSSLFDAPIPLPMTQGSAGSPAVASPLFMGIVTAAAADALAHTTRWTYTVKKATKATAGYGTANWTAGSTSYTAFNCAENVNTGAQGHVEGNGVNPAHLDLDASGNDDANDEYHFMPIQVGTPVLVMIVDVTGGTREYWIVGAGLPNGVDGLCAGV